MLFLAAVRLVSQQWRELAEDDRLWRRLHNERLGGPLVLKYSKNPIRKQVERNRRKYRLRVIRVFFLQILG